MKKLLEVGDVISYVKHGVSLKTVTITRCTGKAAIYIEINKDGFPSEVRFKRKIPENGYIQSLNGQLHLPSRGGHWQLKKINNMDSNKIEIRNTENGHTQIEAPEGLIFTVGSNVYSIYSENDEENKPFLIVRKIQGYDFIIRPRSANEINLL